MFNKKKRKMYLAMTFICASGLINPINPVSAESVDNKIKIEKQKDDINEIPDKYNTGVNTYNSVMTTYNGEEIFTGKKGDEDVEITIKCSNAKEKKYMFNFMSGNNRNLSGEIVVRNMDFSGYTISTASEDLVKNKLNIVFENCKIHYIIKEKSDSNVKFTFNNCSIVRFAGSNASFDRCAFGGTHIDPIIPFKHVTVKNSYVTDISHPANDGAHIDGTQIYGIEYEDKQTKKKIHEDSVDISFDNCRFEVPAIKYDKGNAYVNACIMIQLEYSDGHDISFKNCIANGGSSAVYAHAVGGRHIDNVSLENLRIGGANINNTFYNDIDDNVVLKNILATDSLYIASVSEKNGKTVFSVTNDTIIDRNLKIITDKGEYDFKIKAGPSGVDLNNRKFTSYEQMPFDVPVEIDEEIKYAVCLDVTNPEYVKQIRFINYTNEDVYLDKSYFGGDEALNNNVLLSGNCGENVSFVLTKDGVITISGEGEMKNYHSADLPPWQDYKGIIKKVIIEEGVTSIGAQAFNRAFAIEDVVIADTVEVIRKRAFACCASLTNINFPEKLTTIEEEVFEGVRKCVYQKSEEDSKNDDKSEGDANKNSNTKTANDKSNNSKAKIKVGMIIKDKKTGFVYKVTSIKGTPKLSLIKCSKQKKKIKVKGSVKLLGRKFKVTSIGKKAFRKNKKVKTIYINKGVKKISKGAFKKCKKLRKIVVKNKKFTKKYLRKRGLSKKVKVVKK